MPVCRLLVRHSLLQCVILADRPRHPDNREDFFKSAVQLEGQPGDVVMFAGQIQHCAMTNNTTQVRCGILQQMVLRIIDNQDGTSQRTTKMFILIKVPLFVTPFEAISQAVEEESKDIKLILARDHPHPVIKHTKK